MPLSAIIIEDELAALKSIRSLLTEFIPEVVIVGEARNIEEGIEAIKSLQPELIFLDLELEGKHGMEVLVAFEQPDFEVVITTAYSHYAINSYEYGVTDYLLKPITPSLLRRAVGRVTEKLELRRASKRSEITLSTISITVAEGTRIVRISDIVRLEADRNYTRIYFDTGKPLLSSKTLSHFEEKLKEYQFLRVHHSHLINPQHIKSVIKSKNIIEMSDETSIPVSRDKKKILDSLF